jgi:hypothetical protein
MLIRYRRPHGRTAARRWRSAQGGAGIAPKVSKNPADRRGHTACTTMPMHQTLGRRRNELRLAGALLAGFMWACGGTTIGSETGDASTPGDAVARDGSVPVPPSCPPAHEGLQPYDTAASGTITGAGLSGVFCNATADVYLSSHTTPAGRFLLQLNSGEALSASFSSPKLASHAEIVAMISMSAASPGVYKSSDGEACGTVLFSYALPVPAGVNCEGKTGPSCPKGCASACSGFGCEPCTAEQPEVDYSAQAASDCLGETQTVAGSWTLTLTSVVPYEGGAGGSGAEYKAHGTLVATLLAQGDTGTNTTATFSATF